MDNELNMEYISDYSLIFHLLIQHGEIYDFKFQMEAQRKLLTINMTEKEPS